MDVYPNNRASSYGGGTQEIATFSLCNRFFLKKMGFTCLIIDDELLARKRIRKLLESETDITLLKECSNGETAVNLIQKLKPDFVFLDIEMKDMTGFDVLSSISFNPIPIFVSAHDDYAINAFEYQAFDFLLKPYDRERFNQCLDRVKHYLTIKKYSLGFEGFESVLREMTSKIDGFQKNYLVKYPVKIGNKTIFIDTNEIVYFLASGSYSELFLIDKKLILRESLTSINGSLDKSKFLRIHRSTIINKDYIQEVQTSSYYEVDIVMPKNRKFRVSKSYRTEVLKNLGL